MEIFDRAPFREVEENSKGAPALSEAKIVRTRVERERIDLFTTTGKGDKETFFSSVCRGKSSSGTECRQENGIAVQVFRNSSVQPRLRLYKAATNTSKLPKTDKISKTDNRDQAR